MVTTAIVKIWGVNVGLLVWDSDANYAAFQYDKDFWRRDVQLSPIELRLQENSISFKKDSRLMGKTFKGLPGLFADSLPDKYGMRVINAWLQTQGRRANSANPVELLSFIGRRGMGALEFYPEYPKSMDKSSKIEINSLVKIANDILSERQEFKEKIGHKPLLDMFKVGTTAGGAQAKAVIAFNPKTKQIRSGQVDAPPGFSHWIIKFDGVKKDDEIIMGRGRIEFAYYLMAKDCGIHMNECRILEENGLAHFMTKRFDRDGNKKIHMQTFSAIRHFDYDGTNSYEDLFETMRFMKLPQPQIDQMFRRMVFNVLAVNCDDHTKNFSFLMDRDGTWKISPAYDITFMYSTDPYGNKRHASSVNGKTRNITRLDFWDVAKRSNIKKPDDIISDVSAVIKNWKNYADRAKVDSEFKNIIDKHLIRM